MTAKKIPLWLRVVLAAGVMTAHHAWFGVARRGFCRGVVDGGVLVAIAYIIHAILDGDE